MRKPLTRQNSTRDKRRYSAYQNRIFFYLVTLVTAPLLLLGVLSSVVYHRQTVTRSGAARKAELYPAAGRGRRGG